MGPPFYIFRHCDTVQKSHWKNIFWKFFLVPKGSPFIFFSFFATSWSFTKPEGSPLFNLSLGYGADFDRSRLVLDCRDFSYSILEICAFLFTVISLRFCKYTAIFSTILSFFTGNFAGLTKQFSSMFLAFAIWPFFWSFCLFTDRWLQMSWHWTVFLLY